MNYAWLEVMVNIPDGSDELTADRQEARGSGMLSHSKGGD